MAGLRFRWVKHGNADDHNGRRGSGRTAEEDARRRRASSFVIPRHTPGEASRSFPLTRNPAWRRRLPRLPMRDARRFRRAQSGHRTGRLSLTFIFSFTYYPKPIHPTGTGLRKTLFVAARVNRKTRCVVSHGSCDHSLDAVVFSFPGPCADGHDTTQPNTAP